VHEFRRRVKSDFTSFATASSGDARAPGVGESEARGSGHALTESGRVANPVRMAGPTTGPDYRASLSAIGRMPMIQGEHNLQVRSVQMDMQCDLDPLTRPNIGWGSDPST